MSFYMGATTILPFSFATGHGKKANQAGQYLTLPGLSDNRYNEKSRRCGQVLVRCIDTVDTLQNSRLSGSTPPRARNRPCWQWLRRIRWNCFRHDKTSHTNQHRIEKISVYKSLLYAVSSIEITRSKTPNCHRFFAIHSKTVLFLSSRGFALTGQSCAWNKQREPGDLGPPFFIASVFPPGIELPGEPV